MGLASIAVPNVYMAGRSEVGEFSISMFEANLSGALRVDARGEALLTDEATPNFWLEGRMTIKLRLSDHGKTISLVSRNPVLQAGRVRSWPPYGTVMRDISGPNEYVPIDKQDSDPLLVLWSGSITIGESPSDFLTVDTAIRSFEYVPGSGPGKPAGVKLNWRDLRSEFPSITYYQVFRRELGTGRGEGIWERVSGNIEAGSFVDERFDGSRAMTYNVRQVFVDIFGDEILGPGSMDAFTVPALPKNFDQLQGSGFL